MTYSEACCSLPPVVSNYKKTGAVVEYNGLPIYTVGPQVRYLICDKKSSWYLQMMTRILQKLFWYFTIFLVFSKKISVLFFFLLTILCNSPNAFQFCDILANNCGWKVILPDYFRGDYCTKELQANRAELMKWIGAKASLEKVCNVSVVVI